MSKTIIDLGQVMPIKGRDYFTEEEINEFVGDIAETIETSVNSTYESTNNKVSEVSGSSTDDKYPSAKLVNNESKKLDNRINILNRNCQVFKTCMPNETAEGTAINLQNCNDVPLNSFEMKGVHTKNLAWTGWAEDFATRINNTSKTQVTTFDNKNCLFYQPFAASPETADNYLFKIKDGFKTNTQYTFSYDIYAVSTKLQNLRIVYTDNSDASMGSINASATWEHKTFTSASGKTIKQLIVYNLGGDGNYIDLDTFQVEEGTTATEYEAYKVVTGDVTVNVLGKNLLNVLESEAGGIDASGTEVTASGNWRANTFISVLPNTTYTISQNKTGTLRLYEYDKNKNFISPRIEFTGINRTFTTTSNTTYFKWVVYSNSVTVNLEYVKGLNLQLEIGSTATTYEPYQTPQTVTLSLGSIELKENDTIHKDNFDWKINDEKITDSTLLQQLQQLEKTSLFEGTNNIFTVTENTSPILKVNANKKANFDTIEARLTLLE